MAEGRPEVEAAVAGLAADLREWLAWAEDTGAVELPAFDAPAAPAHARVTPSRLQTVPDQAARGFAPGGPGPGGAGVARPVQVGRPRLARAPARAPGAPDESLEQVRAELGECDRCPLHAGRRNIVFGVGSPVAELMLIGEGPGQHEDLTGEPFVGRSGQLLTRMLGAIGLERGAVYIANVVKCRPPGNRDPEPNEVARCSPFLHRQIQAIRPRVIMTLGRFAAQNIVGADGTLGELRRQLHSYQQVPVVVSYHPSYLLRTPAAKRQAWEDLLKVRALLRGV